MRLNAASLVLLLSTAAFAGGGSYDKFAAISYTASGVIAVFSPKSIAHNSVFDSMQLCVGTHQEMDATGIDCHDAIPVPVPAELRSEPKPTARVGIPDAYTEEK